jgi:hypothetical protein
MLSWWAWRTCMTWGQNDRKISHLRCVVVVLYGCPYSAEVGSVDLVWSETLWRILLTESTCSPWRGGGGGKTKSPVPVRYRSRLGIHLVLLGRSVMENCNTLPLVWLRNLRLASVLDYRDHSGNPIITVQKELVNRSVTRLQTQLLDPKNYSSKREKNQLLTVVTETTARSK